MKATLSSGPAHCSAKHQDSGVPHNHCVSVCQRLLILKPTGTLWSGEEWKFLMLTSCVSPLGLTAVQCPVLHQLENGAVSCGENVDSRFSYGSTCSFTCAPGYRLAGPSAMTCTSAAEWSQPMPHCEGKFFPAAFQLPCVLLLLLLLLLCVFSIVCANESCSVPPLLAIKCPEPEIQSSVQMSCIPSRSSPISTMTLYPLGVVCTFGCDKGHELLGATSMECQNQGQWSSAPPTCTGTQVQANP